MGRTPQWLRKSTKASATNTYEPVPEDVKIIVRILERFLEGMMAIEIANVLNEEKTHFHGKEEPWNSKKIRDLLKNRYLIGEPPGAGASGKQRQSRYPAVIETDLFQRVQETREDAKQYRGTGRPKADSRNLFSGLLQCSVCGSDLSYTTSKEESDAGDKQDSPHLYCKKSRNQTCLAKRIRYSYLEANVLQLLRSYYNISTLIHDAEKKDDLIQTEEKIRGCEQACRCLEGEIDSRSEEATGALKQELSSMTERAETLRKEHENFIEAMHDSADYITAERELSLFKEMLEDIPRHPDNKESRLRLSEFLRKNIKVVRLGITKTPKPGYKSKAQPKDKVHVTMEFNSCSVFDVLFHCDEDGIENFFHSRRLSEGERQARQEEYKNNLKDGGATLSDEKELDLLFLKKAEALNQKILEWKYSCKEKQLAALNSHLDRLTESIEVHIGNKELDISPTIDLCAEDKTWLLERVFLHLRLMAEKVDIESKLADERVAEVDEMGGDGNPNETHRDHFNRMDDLRCEKRVVRLNQKETVSDQAKEYLEFIIEMLTVGDVDSSEIHNACMQFVNFAYEYGHILEPKNKKPLVKAFSNLAKAFCQRCSLSSEACHIRARRSQNKLFALAR